MLALRQSSRNAPFVSALLGNSHRDPVSWQPLPQIICHFERGEKSAAAFSKNKQQISHSVRNDRFDSMGTSNNPVVPAQAGTQSAQVLENTVDWIPAYAGMTNY